MSINLLDRDAKPVRIIEHDSNILPDNIEALAGTRFSARKNFSIVDLWNIRNRKRHYSIYRNRLDL